MECMNLAHAGQPREGRSVDELAAAALDTVRSAVRAWVWQGSYSLMCVARPCWRRGGPLGCEDPLIGR